MSNSFSGVVRILLVVIVILVSLAKKAGKKTDAEKKKAAERLAEAAPPLTPGNQTRRGARRAQAAQTELWRAAKRQQDDAAQVHSIHMDSCESRLESLRVLYDAGILDREEYAERVARVKQRHAQGGAY